MSTVLGSCLDLPAAQSAESGFHISMSLFGVNIGKGWKMQGGDVSVMSVPWEDTSCAFTACLTGCVRTGSHCVCLDEGRLFYCLSVSCVL